MRKGSFAAVALVLLIVPQMLLAQQAVRPQPSGSTEIPANSSAPPPAQAAQTPREEEEMRADIFMARKQYADAVAIYQKLVQQEPRNPVLLNKLGIAYHQQTMLDQAKRYYERAVKADRNYANAYNNIGTIYYQRRQFGKAVRAYKKALQIRTDMSAVYSNLGYAYFMQKHYEDALAAFHRALELDPEVFERGQRSGSLLQDRSVENHGLFYYFLAKSFAAMGNAERCAHYLRKARDEGYTDLAAAKTDPAFARVINDPSVQEILQLASPSASKTPPAPPGS
jgi:tetratricopeptide (TPR) repeat protein